MRNTFATELYNHMVNNENIWLLCGDVGFGMFDQIKNDFPKRFINCWASEQAMLGIGLGLALKGKVPFVYTITPFLLYRSFETIRNYIDYEKIPVKLIGSGRGRDYKDNGLSHWADEDHVIMNHFDNIVSFWPDNLNQVKDILPNVIIDNNPWYINLKR